MRNAALFLRGDYALRRVFAYSEQPLKFRLVYNFIGAYDFEAATAQAETDEKTVENGVA